MSPIRRLPRHCLIESLVGGLLAAAVLIAPWAALALWSQP